jgi:hypothetical protein
MAIATFKQAVRRQAMLGSLVNEGNRETAEQIYAGVTGHGHFDTLVGHAVADTVPTEYAVLVMTDDIAGAFASAALLRAFDESPAPTTPRQARIVAEQGWAEFRKLADQAGHQLHGTGADMSDAWPVFKQVQQMGVRDKRRMQEIATLAGRMLKALKGAKEKRVEDIPEEIVGVKRGAELSSLLPREYALLALPQTQMETTRRLLGAETQQYEKIGKEKMGRGPLAILVDESGSMNDDPDHPGRNTWAKAAATALTRMAWADKRDVVWVHFSTATRSVVLKPGDHQALAKAQTSFLDGGTDIGAGLRVATDEIKDLAKRGQKGADAVLISDGGNAGRRIGNALDELDAVGARLFSVAIGKEFQGDLKDRAARYVHLDQEDMGSTDGAVAVGGAVGA